jgi:AraC-like DNA-binding protein
METYQIFSAKLPWIDAVHSSRSGHVRSIRYHNQPPLYVELSDCVALTVQAGSRYSKTRKTSTSSHCDTAAVGRAFLDGPGERMYLDVRGECQVVQFKLPAPLFNRFLLEDHDEPRGLAGLRPLHGQIDLHLLLLLSKALLADEQSQDLALREVVARIVSTNGRSADSGPSRGIPPARLRRVRDLVAAHPDTVTIGAMATEAGMSLYHFAREFRRETGQTPWRFVNQWRVWEAVRLMRAGNYTIEEIARLVGFAHASHMGRGFRSQLGASPRAIGGLLLP